MGEVRRHHCDSRYVGVRLDREVAARRAVCRASRPPDTWCTCTEADTAAALLCRRRCWRAVRSDCPTSSARSIASCVSPSRCGSKPSRTPSYSFDLQRVHTNYQVIVHDDMWKTNFKLHIHQRLASVRTNTVCMLASPMFKCPVVPWLILSVARAYVTAWPILKF